MADMDQVKDKNHEGDSMTSRGAPKVLRVHKSKTDKKEKGAGSRPRVRCRNDVGWQHGTAIANNSSQIKCNYCHMEYSGGAYRFKHHLAGTHKNVAACRAVPNEVRQQMLDNVNKLKSNLIEMGTPSEDVEDNEATARALNLVSHSESRAMEEIDRVKDKNHEGDNMPCEANEKLMTCIPILEKLEGIGGGPFTKALKLLKEDPVWRDVFLALSDDRKKDLVVNL